MTVFRPPFSNHAFFGVFRRNCRMPPVGRLDPRTPCVNRLLDFGEERSRPFAAPRAVRPGGSGHAPKSAVARRRGRRRGRSPAARLRTGGGDATRRAGASGGARERGGRGGGAAGSVGGRSARWRPNKRKLRWARRPRGMVRGLSRTHFDVESRSKSSSNFPITEPIPINIMSKAIIDTE